ncbi:hypothetical protein Acy02nite_35120 [Actinoplanes cyaneus]|uniref:OmpR/PhoB-type domain-containing protein n=1 Tax=Actinoplanes cyaneus TaxID=52696 RepID=A0A919MC03_9ACTN|nr:BTAD domain-containing putative transcriptional regulator [Actinoplanes cyaneus]MCW2140313.1 Transcriptional regulatory protein, C terminal [Actinoplanes cyaneus]GID65631.1 hypothetical protein Acy02nite_35120 [Actinoplanes cyaneus]
MIGGALRFEILGPLRAFRDDQPVDLGPLTQQAVLAVLLLHAGEPVPIARLVTALWDHDPPENGVDLVQRYIGGLRRALDPGRTSLIALTEGGYVLRVSDSAIDAGRFRTGLEQARAEQRTGRSDTATLQVRRALDLWRDEPLSGLTGPVFEAGRTRLRRERDTAAQLLAAPAPPPSPPAAVDPTAVHPAPVADPTAVHPVPAADPTAAQPVTTVDATVAQPVPTADATRAQRVVPGYSEPVDPWEGHDLFPPDPLRF